MLIKSIFRFLEGSSILVPIIVGIYAIVFYKLCLLSPDYISIAQLMSASWCIYIFDGLFDNLNKTNTRLDLRHEYVQTHQFNLCILLIGLLVINIVLIFFQSKSIIIFGVIIIFLLALYFLALKNWQSFKYYKELFMPFIFVIAISAPAIITASSVTSSTYVLSILFLILIFINILSISYLEILKDENALNIAQKIKPNRLRKTVLLLSSVNLFMGLLLFTDGYKAQVAYSIVLVSILNSLYISIFKEKHLHFKLIIDALLLFGIVLII